LGVNYSEPIVIDWIVDINGNKISLPVTNEQRKVVAGRCVLDYLPDFFYKVACTSGTPSVEININKPITLVTQYKVDYNTGYVYTHPSLEGSTLSFNYYKRGILFYPASRVYTDSTGLQVTETLEQKLENYDNSLQDTIDGYDVILAEKVNQYDGTIAGYQAAENTRISNDATRTSNENVRISNENSRVNAEGVRVSQENNREIGYNLMLNESLAIYKPPVDTFTDLASTYPTPDNGWLVRVLDTFRTYRYNSTLASWVWVDTITSSAYDALTQFPIDGGDASSLFDLVTISPINGGGAGTIF
jgi:hypothetical protein